MNQKTGGSVDKSKAGEAVAEPLPGEQVAAFDVLKLDALEMDGGGPVGAAVVKPQQMESGVMCAAVLGLVFGMVADRRGKHWVLSAGECESLGDAVGAVLDKYMPDMNSGPEAVLVVSLLVVVGPRVMADKALLEKIKGGDRGDSTESEID